MTFYCHSTTLLPALPTLLGVRLMMSLSSLETLCTPLLNCGSHFFWVPWLLSACGRLLRFFLFLLLLLFFFFCWKNNGSKRALRKSMCQIFLGEKEISRENHPGMRWSLAASPILKASKGHNVAA